MKISQIEHPWLTCCNYGTLLVYLALMVLWDPLSHRYNRIALGMSREVVESTLRTEIVLECRLGDYTVVNYDTDHISVQRRVPDDFDPDVADPSKLPFLYGTYQVLYDERGIMRAITFNGEDLTIRTVLGAYPGSHFTKLPPEFWQRMNER